ncbi:MAG: glycogen debranching protein GlgX [Lautropia sp.]|nr:glycogen debranching protein GlgX [Lautropia sp.]
MRKEPINIGHTSPLGATCRDGGVNFAVFSGGARSVTLCLFNEDGQEIRQYALNGPKNGIWYGFLPDADPDLIYGYRVDGPYDPSRGLRYNPHRLLLDPYARQLHGEFRWHESHLDRPDTQTNDNAAYMPKAVVHDDAPFDWEGDRSPSTPMARSIIYEAHVKGFTNCNPGVPAELRGTYEGLGSPASVKYLKRLGVTAIELLPIQESVSEGTLIEMGLSNYWGYNTLAFFAPARKYARQDPVREFREMVKALHKGGIEVIMDVVYNHTPEGDQRGPTLSWRGLDNQAYYHLSQQDPAYYNNYTGTGNSLNLSNPHCLKMVMDSLRYWVTEMHVDGFRFDLASTLGRVAWPGDPNAGNFSRYAPFFVAMAQDPILARVKWIAEPWDAAGGGYQLGAYLPGWNEWNDRFRDTVRRFWLQPGKNRGAFASQMSGASEQFYHSGRHPQASINFITAHDGFTLNDLVTYSHKHNEANGEDNRDGHNENLSWNAGTEGPSDDPAIQQTRGRLKRSMMASLLLAQGTPMLTAGDEISRTQGGNNNAYNQDNTISWLDWGAADVAMFNFTAYVIGLRKKHPQLRLPTWLLGTPTASGALDVQWLNADGGFMQAEAWSQADNGVFGQLLGAHDDKERNLLILFNPDKEPHSFVMPEGDWVLVLDCAQSDGRPIRADSPDSQIDEAQTQIMRRGLPIPGATSASKRNHASAATRHQTGVAARTRPVPLSRRLKGPSHLVNPVTSTGNGNPTDKAVRPQHLLLPHCLYLFVARSTRTSS